MPNDWSSVLVAQRFGRSGAQTEFRARRRAAVVADDYETQAPANAESGAVSESPGVSVGGGAHQAVQPGSDLLRATALRDALWRAAIGIPCISSF